MKKVSDTIDNDQRVCYYNVSIIPYWTYEVLTVIRVAVRRGNQVRVLSDPVTVTEERLFNIPLYDSMRRGRGAMILKSGNLLCMARLNFRVKCNNQLGDIRNPGALSADWKQTFFYGIRLFVWIIPLCLWWPPQTYNPQRVWLNGRRYYSGCIRSLRIFERIHCLPRSSIAILLNKNLNWQHDLYHSCFFLLYIRCEMTPIWYSLWQDCGLARFVFV